MNTLNNKISKLILEVCEELLPRTTEANNAKIKKVLKLAIEEGWNYANRLHIDLFGDKAGV